MKEFEEETTVFVDVESPEEVGTQQEGQLQVRAAKSSESIEEEQ